MALIPVGLNQAKSGDMVFCQILKNQAAFFTLQKNGMVISLGLIGVDQDGSRRAIFLEFSPNP